MDASPSGSRGLRQRLWGLFKVYSTAEALCDSAEAQRLEAAPFRQCLNALARLNSFRALFVGSEDDMAIRTAATRLQSRIAQDVLWNEALARDAKHAMHQQQRPDHLVQDAAAAAAMKAVQWPSNDTFAEDDLLGETCFSATSSVLSSNATLSSMESTCTTADSGVSWRALYTVVVLYLYDQHRFHHSFLPAEIDALRDGEGNINAHARVAACVEATGARRTHAGVRAPGTSTIVSVYAPPPSPRRRSTEIHVDLRLDTEDDDVVAAPLGLPLQTPPRLPRRDLLPSSPQAPSQASAVPAHGPASTAPRAAVETRAAQKTREDIAKPAPPPLRKHTRRVATELPAEHPQPPHPLSGVIVTQCGPARPQSGAQQHRAQEPLARWSPVSVSSASSCASPTAAVTDVQASPTRRLWSTSPSPRRPEGYVAAPAPAAAATKAAVTGLLPPPQEPAATPSLPIARALRLRLRSLSEQNAMHVKHAGKRRHAHERRPRHKDGATTSAAALRPKLAAAAGQSCRQRIIYTTRRPQGAKEPEVDCDTCSHVPAPAALRPVETEAWPRRRDHDAELAPTPPPTPTLTPPPTTRHDDGGTSGAPMSRRVSTGSEAPNTGGAVGRRTTALTVERVGGTLQPGHSGSNRSSTSSGEQPSWVRHASRVKASPSPIPPALTVSPDGDEEEQWMAEATPQAPPTQTSRRRGPPHTGAYPSPFSTLREPFHPASRDLVGRSAAAAVLQPHATAPSPTPTPREVDSCASPASSHSVRASAMQRAKPCPRQPQHAHHPVSPPPPHKLTDAPRPLTPSCTLLSVGRLASFTPADAHPASQPSASASASQTATESRSSAGPHDAMAAQRVADEIVNDNDDGLYTPPRRWSPERQSAAVAAAVIRPPGELLSPYLPRTGSAAMSPVSPAAGRAPVDCRSPPPRLSARARVRSSSHGSRTLQTPPQVPLTRVIMSPTGSLQVTPCRLQQ